MRGRNLFSVESTAVESMGFQPVYGLSRQITVIGELPSQIHKPLAVATIHSQ